MEHTQRFIVCTPNKGIQIQLQNKHVVGTFVNTSISVMIYRRGASLSEQHTYLSLHKASRHVDKSSPEIARYRGIAGTSDMDNIVRGRVLYSYRILSREKTFAILWLHVFARKFSPRNLGVCRYGVLWRGTSEQSAKVFSAKIVFLTNSRKFSPSLA